MNAQKLLLVVGLLVSSCSMNPSEDSIGVQLGERGFVDGFLQSFRPVSVRSGTPLNIYWSNSLWGFGVGQSREELFSSLKGWASTRDEEVHEAMQNFCIRNESPSEFDPLGGLSFNHEIEGSPDNAPSPVFYGSLYKEVLRLLDTVSSPSELILLSQPGFNDEGTVAVIYCATHRGPLDASGELYVLELVGGIWILSKWNIGLCWVA